MPQDENRLTLLRSIVQQEEARDTGSISRALRFQGQMPQHNGFVKQGHIEGTELGRQHESLRESLEADVDAFIASGGQIEKVPTLDKFEMTGHVGYQIHYGSKDGRRRG